jgi:hypothetical protein
LIQKPNIDFPCLGEVYEAMDTRIENTIHIPTKEKERKKPVERDINDHVRAIPMDMWDSTPLCIFQYMH